MRRYSETDPPPTALWWRNVAAGVRAGLTLRTARAYATLTWWGEHYGIKTPAIVSGARSERQQAALRARWDAGDRRGLIVRPALESAHVRGEAFDLRDTGGLRTLGALAPHAGLRWGGKFADRDPVHFDLGAV